MKVQVKLTGEIKTATYATKPNGDKRMWVDGKFYSDKEFCKQFKTINMTTETKHTCECGWVGIITEMVHRDIFDEHHECDQHECPKCLTVIVNNLQDA